MPSLSGAGHTGSTRRRPGLVVARSVMRALTYAAVLLTTYYLLPFDHASVASVTAILAAGIVLLAALVAFQARSILASRYPGLRAIEAIAVSAPFVVLLFAAAYVATSRLSTGSFSQPLTHTDALYFSVTVFSTVGFGDITAKSEAARLLVTGQMIADIVILGIAVKVITAAAKRGRENRQRATDRAGR